MFEIKKKIYKDTVLNIGIESEKFSVVLSSFGAGIFDIKFIDKNGIKESVVAHPQDMATYISSDAQYGRICGRTAGRIDKGEFSLDGVKHHLDKNWNGVSCLHGGGKGISCKNFMVDKVENNGDNVVVEFSTTAEEGESGFSGTLKINVTYTIKENEIQIEYFGKSNKKTLCNLTNHTYFNLSGDCKKDCLNQEVFLCAPKFGVLNGELIATAFESVKENEVFNFMTPKPLGKDIYAHCLQSHIAKGYDHPFLLDKGEISAYLFDKESGRKMIVSTSYPCMVMYSACYPDGAIVASGKEISQYGGICFEAQFLPNGVNISENDGSILEAGKVYHEKTNFKFIIE